MAQRQRNFYAALYGVARVINSSLDLAKVLNQIVEGVAKAMDAKGCSLRLLSSDGQKLLISAAYGLSKQYLSKGPVEVERSGIDREALAGNPVVVLDAARDPRFQYPEEALKEGIRSVLVVPLTIRGQTMGVLRVYTSAPYDFSAEEVDFASAAANLGAIAIENARLYETVKRAYDGLKADLTEWYAAWGIEREAMITGVTAKDEAGSPIHAG